MTFKEYKQLKEDVRQTKLELKKKYEEDLAAYDAVLKQAGHNLSASTRKFCNGDLVLLGSGETKWRIIGHKATITSEGIGHFYDLAPADTSSRFVNNRTRVYENHIKAIENN